MGECAGCRGMHDMLGDAQLAIDRRNAENAELTIHVADLEKDNRQLLIYLSDAKIRIDQLSAVKKAAKEVSTRGILCVKEKCKICNALRDALAELEEGS